MIQEKKNAGYEGEADQHKNCRKKFSNAHMIRNGYIYTDRVLIIKASYYMKKESCKALDGLYSFL